MPPGIVGDLEVEKLENGTFVLAKSSCGVEREIHVRGPCRRPPRSALIISYLISMHVSLL